MLLTAYIIAGFLNVFIALYLSERRTKSLKSFIILSIMPICFILYQLYFYQK